MLFSNTFVSFVTAIALASSVTASITPVRRGSGGNGNGNGKPSQSCSTGSLSCCSTSSPFAALPKDIQDSLLSVLDPSVVAEVPIGLNCVAPGLLGCDISAFCCDSVQNENGLVNVGINCVNV